MASCRSCGAPMLWAKTQKGKAIPLDPKPREDGNIVLREQLDGEGQPFNLAVFLTNNQGSLGSMGESRYVSHFATCPNRKQHRKRDTQ